MSPLNSRPNGKLYFFVELTLQAKNQGEFLRIINEYAVRVRLEPGCEQLDVLTDPKNPESVFLYEIWSDSTSHQGHLASTGFEEWKAISDPLISKFSALELTSSEKIIS